jgi:hypothetical protein
MTAEGTVGAPTGCTTSRATLLLRVVSQISVDQYCSAWAHFKALFGMSDHSDFRIYYWGVSNLAAHEISIL